MRNKGSGYSVRRKLKLLFLCVMVFCTAVSMCVTQAEAKQKSKDTLKINKTVYTMKKGKSVKLKVTKSKSARKKAVVWTSSNSKVASVSSKGKVSAKKNGKAKITASLKGTKVKATCKIVVGTPVKSISLNKKSAVLKAGERFQLKASVSPKKASVKKVSYKSSNPSVAKVSSKGLVTALKPGTAKITVSAQDGTGKSAGCTVTVASNVVAVSKVTLSDTAITLIPGQTKKVTAAVAPANASNKTLTWKSSDEKVVTVAADGTVKAVAEGTATVKATANNGVSAECIVKSAYSDKPGNETELKNALSSKMITYINYSSDAKGEITIPSGDYSSKTLEINAPNAEVNNSGHFKKVIINAIAENTYQENAGNVIYFNAGKGRVVVGENGSATINLQSSEGQEFHLENYGLVNDLHVSGQVVLRLGGDRVIPVTLTREAKDTAITTSAELRITADASWTMLMLPGAENSKAAVGDRSCLPAVEGVGCLPVTVGNGEDKDIVNILAGVSDNPEIDQKVNVTGYVNEYYLAADENPSDEPTDEDPAEEPGSDTDPVQEPGPDSGTEGEPDNVKTAENRASEGADVYLLVYEKDNIISEANYSDYIKNPAAASRTDAVGNFAFSDIQVGNYWLIINKEGFRPLIKSIIITSTNTDTFSCGQSDLISDEIAGCGESPKISGTIKDSLTGESVNAAGIQVKLRAGAGNIIGDVLQTAKTDAEGKYSLKNVPAGIYTIEIMDLRTEGELPEGAVRYNAFHANIIVAGTYLPSDSYDCVLDQQMQDTMTGKGQVQFTLTWGNEASGASADIDSHLVGPRMDGDGIFHAYYGDREYYDNDVLMADLDVDDTDYEGPEHTTIYKETNGIYRFYIHNFSESGVEDSDMMSRSGIQVRVTIGDNSQTFNCPNRKGNLWYVCDYDSVNHKIILRNEMSDFLYDTGDIGLPKEELVKREKERSLEVVSEMKEYLEFRFLENTAKTEFSNRISGFEKQVQSTDELEGLQALRGQLNELQNELGNIQNSFGFTASNVIDWNWDSVDQYDETGEKLEAVRRELILSVKVGNEVKDFAAEESESYTAEVKKADDPQYAYIVHVTDTGSGLEWDIYVRVLADQIAAKILEQVQSCKREMSLFEENDSIRADQARLGVISSSAGTIVTDEDYYEIMNELWAMKEKYVEISGILNIESIGDIDAVDDWWMYSRDVIDEEEVWLDSYRTLLIEYSGNITGEEVLNQLKPVPSSENVTYELLDSDRTGYQKMIRATDGEYTQKIYIDISVY